MNRIPLMSLVATGILATTALLAHSEDLGTKLTDEQITAQVKQELHTNDPTVAPGILVTTRDGVVTLEGFAMTQQDILTALHDAEAVGGVVRVENHLKLG
jgi:osmotically-inducible protein OsmY